MKKPPSKKKVVETLGIIGLISGPVLCLIALWLNALDVANHDIRVAMLQTAGIFFTSGFVALLVGDGL